VAPVKAWGATALLFGQDIQSYQELISILK